MKSPQAPHKYNTASVLGDDIAHPTSPPWAPAKSPIGTIELGMRSGIGTHYWGKEETRIVRLADLNNLGLPHTPLAYQYFRHAVGG